MGLLGGNLECHHGAGGSWGRGGIGRRTRLKIVWDENPVGVQVPPPPPPAVKEVLSSWAFHDHPHSLRKHEGVSFISTSAISDAQLGEESAGIRR